MDGALALSALLMGLAGTPHCLAMCGPACGAVARGCGGARPTRALFTLQAGRLVSYAAGGAVVAGSISALAQWAPGVAWLRPLWLMLHLAALLVGLAMLVRARQPAWLGALGRVGVQPVALPRNGRAPARRAALPHAAFAGLLWVAWPCGLLQSALLVAALASGPAAGAAVMTAFALGSGAGLAAGPALCHAIGERETENPARGRSVRPFLVRAKFHFPAPVTCTIACLLDGFAHDTHSFDAFRKTFTPA